MHCIAVARLTRVASASCYGCHAHGELLHVSASFLHVTHCSPAELRAALQDDQGRWNKFGGRLPWATDAICCNNPTFGGKGNHKTGEDYVAAPNIDHTNARVREDIKAWMKWLRSSIGFDGWRFDFVKGYSAPYAE